MEHPIIRTKISHRAFVPGHTNALGSCWSKMSNNTTNTTLKSDARSAQEDTIIRWFADHVPGVRPSQARSYAVAFCDANQSTIARIGRKISRDANWLIKEMRLDEDDAEDLVAALIESNELPADIAAALKKSIAAGKPSNANSVNIFEHVVEVGSLGLSLVPHRLLYASPSGIQCAIACATVTASANTTDIHCGDVLVSINAQSLLTYPGDAFIVDERHSTAFFENWTKAIGAATFPKTIVIFRPLRQTSAAGTTGTDSTIISLEEAQAVIRGGDIKPITGQCNCNCNCAVRAA